MRDRPWLLFLVLVLLNLLSLIDGAFTAIEISLGIATEGNPVLDAAARTHPLFAAAVKIGAMILVTLGIWHGRTLRAILALALLALALFGGIVAYHVGTLSGLGYL
jgi:hypothetical protein